MGGALSLMYVCVCVVPPTHNVNVSLMGSLLCVRINLSSTWTAFTLLRIFCGQFIDKGLAVELGLELDIENFYIIVEPNHLFKFPLTEPPTL